MRELKSIVPSPKADAHTRRAARDTNDNFRELSAAIRHIDRGEPSSQQGGIPTNGSSIAANDHGDLSGLTSVITNGFTTDYNDDHTQYALLAGRVGGQTLYGSRPSSRLVITPKDTFTFANVKTSASSWASISLDHSAAAGDLVVLALSTDSITATNDMADGTTNDHVSIADTQSNTWTKHQECTHDFEPVTSAGAGTCTSIWTCLVGTDITASVDTLTVTLSGAATAKTIQAYIFEVPSGVTVSAAGTAFGSAASGSNAPSLSISSLTEDLYLFVRADGIEDDNLEAWQLPANYAPFEQDITDRINSNTTGGASRTNNAVRASYQILTGTASTTQPVFNISAFPIISSVAAAIKLSGVSGSLTLQSVDTADAATANLEDNVIHLKGAGSATDRLVIFEDPDSTELSYIQASDGAFVGPLSPTNLENLLNTTYFNDVVAGTAARGDLIVGNSTPAWTKLAVGTANMVLAADGTDTVWTATPKLDDGSLKVQYSLSPSTQYGQLGIGTLDLYHTGATHPAVTLSETASGTPTVGLIRVNNATSQEKMEVGTTSAHKLQLLTSGSARLVIGSSGTMTTFPTMATNIVMGNNSITGIGFLGVKASAATANGEAFRITQSGYGLVHDDGTRQLGTYVDATGGWIGMNTNTPLTLYTNNAAQNLLAFNTSAQATFYGNIVFNSPSTQTINGITAKNLLDATASEEIGADWTWRNAQINFEPAGLGLNGVYIHSAATGYLDLVGDTAIRFNTDTADTDVIVQFIGTTNSGEFRWMEDEDYFDFQDDVRMPQGIFDADTGGIASTNTMTGATDTPTTDPGWTTSSSVDMNAPDGYMKMYVGTQAVVVPYWNT